MYDVLSLSYNAIIFYCSIIVDYDFERFKYTHCSHGDESFDTLDNAKSKCKKNDECTGIFQKNCADHKDYHECLKDDFQNNAQNQGCIYKKFSVGKYIKKNFLHFEHKLL